VDTIERARDLGLGRYDAYIDSLDTLSSVNTGMELFLGAHLETLGYPPIANRSGWTYSSDYPQVVLALTTYQLHNAIAEDRLSVLNPTPATNPNIVQQYLDSAQTYCASGCPSQSKLAYRVLTGMNSPSSLYQGLYFSTIATPDILLKMKSAITVTLFYDLLGIHYNDFNDSGLPGFTDDCIPNVLTLTPQEASAVTCGCCLDPSGGGFSTNPGC